MREEKGKEFGLQIPNKIANAVVQAAEDAMWPAHVFGSSTWKDPYECRLKQQQLN